ncbi:DMT family transporter [Candidatus Similichlamydia epinepheli]|uniref:DMT family transporter n=1 Tax=Candidatus Similichlamydia epinepheli TaxID=1903953 RepID=UPI000D3CAE53|nr:DMT family transporter [Candidatus Similichlamydia epinepheli]
MKRSKIAVLKVLIAYASIAATMLLSHSILNDGNHSPFLLVAVRMSIGGVVLLLIQMRNPFLAPSLYDWFKVVQLAFFQSFLSFNCEAWAIQHISVAKAQLLYNLTPFLTALLLIRKRTPSRLQWIYISLAFLSGSSLISWRGEIVSLSIPEWIMFLAVLSGSIGWIYFKRLLERGYSPVFLNGISMMLGGFFSWALCCAMDVPIIITNQRAFFRTILILLFLSNFFFYGIYSRALKYHSPAFLALLGQLTPYFSAIYELIWFGKPISSSFIANVTVTIIVTFLFQKEEKRLWGRSDSN